MATLVVRAISHTVQVSLVHQARAKSPPAPATVARTAPAPAVWIQTLIPSAIAVAAAMFVVQAMFHMERVLSVHRARVKQRPVIPAIARRMVFANPETSIPTLITAEAAVTFVVRAMIPMPQHLSVFPVSVKRPHAMVTIAR